MKLTEAKLKQMISEALKSSKFQDFDVLTPDEKLRSQLGDEMFDKIQSLDSEQGGTMKQTFDPNYPQNIKQESLNQMLQAAGFKFKDSSKYTSAPTMHVRYNHRHWHKGAPNAMGTSTFKVEYNVSDDFLRYTVRISTRGRFGANNQASIARGQVTIPPMFELSLETDQGLRDADAIMLSKEKQTIEKALEQYK